MRGELFSIICMLIRSIKFDFIRLLYYYYYYLVRDTSYTLYYFVIHANNSLKKF